MDIAFLGWGSLVWDKRELKIKGRWKFDGPFLPIEYARKSSRGRLTLVLHPGAKRVRTLWVYSVYNNNHKAIRNLRDREGILPKDTYRIGYVSIYDDKFNSHVVRYANSIIEKWAIKKGLGAVIWTDLPGNFKPFSENEAIRYLKGLKSQDNARQYIQKTPKQIKTHLRPIIKQELDW